MKKLLSSYWFRSAFYTFLQRFSTTLFGFFTYMLLARNLSEAQLGIWAIFLIVIALFEMTKVNLLKNAHIRFFTASTSMEEKVQISSTSLVMNATVTGAFVLFLAFFSSALSYFFKTGDTLSNMLLYFIPGILCMIPFSHFEAIQQSNFDFKGVFAGYFTRNLCFFGCIAFHLITKTPFSLERLAIYQSGAMILGVLALYITTRKYMYHKFSYSKNWTGRIVGYGGYIFGSGLMSNIHHNLDQLMIARFMPTPDYVAYYNNATRIKGFVDVPSYAATEVIFPKLSKASADEGPARVRYLYERMVAVLLSFTIPAALFIILFPKLIIGIVVGAKYLEAAPILQIYMITGLIAPMQNQAANLLNSIGKTRLCFWINTISLIVYLAIALLCLKYIGFLGAAIGSLITAVLGMTAWHFVMKKEIGFEYSSIFAYIVDTYKQIFVFGRNMLLKKGPKEKEPPSTLSPEYENSASTVDS